MKFFNIAKMPKKPFSLRSVQCTHIKYTKKMKKFDRKYYHVQNQKIPLENPFFLYNNKKLLSLCCVCVRVGPPFFAGCGASPQFSNISISLKIL